MALPTTIQLLTDAISKLHAKLYGPQLISTQYSEEFNKEVGDYIKVPVEPVYTAYDFAGSVTEQEAYEDSVQVKLEKFKDVTITVGAKDKKLTPFDFEQRHLMPAMTAISKVIEADIWAKSKEVYNPVKGIAGAPDTFEDLGKIESWAAEQGIPAGEITAMVDFATYNYMLGNIEDIRTAEKRGDNGTAIRTASIGEVAGVDFFRSAYMPKKAAVIAANGLGTSTVLGADLALDATTVTLSGFDANDTLSDGDIIEFLDASGETQGYVVANLSADHDLTVDGATVAIHASDFAITSASNDSVVYHNIAYNIVFHSTALSFASVTLDEVEDAADSAFVVDPETNISMRLVAGKYDLSTKKTKWSLDCLYGVNLTRPELIARFDGIRG